jgi:phosphatidylglycerophosphate synthase
MKNRNDQTIKPTFPKLKEILGENKWNEFVDNFEKKLEEILNTEVKLDLSNLRIEYKRDEQQAINTAITSGVEEKAKEWICPRIPEWMSPDHLTIIGILGMIITAVGFVWGFFNKVGLVLLPIGLIINWFGDSFDGSIARYRKRTRPNYGYYIDKIVDAIAVIILVLGIGLSGFVKIEIALLLGLMYLSLMLHVDLIVYVENKCQNSFGLFGPTEMRILGIILSIIMYFLPVKYYDIYGHLVTQYDFLVLTISVIMFLILVISVVRKGLELNERDTKDWKM